MNTIFLRNLLYAIILLAAAPQATSCGSRQNQTPESEIPAHESAQKEILPGAARTDIYKPLLEGKRVALLSNHTGIVGDRHTVDIMLENGINVVTLLSPEHGFRGNADAGQHVKSGTDSATGLPVQSLYSGKNGAYPTRRWIPSMRLSLTSRMSEHASTLITSP